jgi:hypothetical protein
LPTEGNTDTNPTSKTTATARPEKQNEGEKQIFFCASTKICHLTHFFRIGIKDTNELVDHDFNGWYAGQTFSRSTDTTPPVDLVFDTKTNTFLERVPSFRAKLI